VVVDAEVDGDIAAAAITRPDTADEDRRALSTSGPVRMLPWMA